MRGTAQPVLRLQVGDDPLDVEVAIEPVVPRVRRRAGALSRVSISGAVVDPNTIPIVKVLNKERRIMSIHPNTKFHSLSTGFMAGSPPMRGIFCVSWSASVADQLLELPLFFSQLLQVPLLPHEPPPCKWITHLFVAPALASA